jgi:hypothetical protein
MSANNNAEKYDEEKVPMLSEKILEEGNLQQFKSKKPLDTSGSLVVFMWMVINMVATVGIVFTNKAIFPTRI